MAQTAEINHAFRSRYPSLHDLFEGTPSVREFSERDRELLTTQWQNRLQSPNRELQEFARRIVDFLESQPGPLYFCVWSDVFGFFSAGEAVVPNIDVYTRVNQFLDAATALQRKLEHEEKPS